MITARLANQFGRELFWVRPQLFVREHRLMAGHDTIAVMRFRGFHSAEALTATGKWVINRRGLLFIGADMTDARTGHPVLALRSRPFKRWLEISDGRTFRFRGFGFLVLNQELTNQNGQALLRCSHLGPFSQRRGKLELLPAAPADQLLDPLALISWYLVARMRQRSAAQASG